MGVAARSAGLCPAAVDRAAWPQPGRAQSYGMQSRGWTRPWPQPGRARLYSPMTSVPLGGAKLKVPAAKDGLRFQPVKVITVR
ncbi:hypothetical protein ABIA71_001017 [Stenotrophomonas sp. 2619]